MRLARISMAGFLVAWIAGFATATPSVAADHNLQVIHTQAAQEMLEMVGEVNNSATPAPLGSSIQFGYVSFLNGLDGIFSGSPADETTAQFTFYTAVNTTRVTAHGPFSVILREGTTTLYLNSAPASFGTPDSFRSGTPIQVSSIHQQVIVDTTEKTFTVVNSNVINSASPFLFNGAMTQIGAPGEGFRTSLQGVLTVRSGGTPPPTGFFSGYAVGVENGDKHKDKDSD